MAPTEDPTADGTNPSTGSHGGSSAAAAGSAVPTGGGGAPPPPQQGSGSGLVAGGTLQSDPPYVRDLNVHSLLNDKLGPGMMIKQGLQTGVEVEEDGWVSVVLRGRWIPQPQS